MAQAQVVQATCPGCKAVLRIPADWLHKPIRCKNCGTTMQTRGPATATPPPQVAAKPPVLPAKAPPLPTAARPAPRVESADVRLDLRLWDEDEGKSIRVRAPHTMSAASFERFLQAFRLVVRIEAPPGDGG